MEAPNAASPETSATDPLSSLPLNALQAILGRLTPKNRASVAATSQQMLASVLTALSGAVWPVAATRAPPGPPLSTGRTVARRLHAARAGPLPAQPSLVGWETAPDGRFLFYVPAGADPDQDSSVVKIVALAIIINPRDAGAAVVAPIRPGMTGLREIDFVVDKWDIEEELGPAWIPEPVARGLEVLRVGGMTSHRHSILSAIMPGLESLRELDVSGCRELAGEWLPASSARQLRKLAAAATRLERLPEGMGALEEVVVKACVELAEDWLPASSAARLRRLVAERSSLQRLPGGMGALEELDVTGCRGLAEDWLPASSAAAVRVLRAGAINLPSVPATLVALQELDVTTEQADRDVPEDDWYRRPVPDDFVPESVAKGLRILNVERKHFRRLPRGLRALEQLDVSFGFTASGVSGVDEADLMAVIASLGGTLRVLDAAWRLSEVATFPSGMRVLEHLNVSYCWNFSFGEELPETLAFEKLKYLNVSSTAVTRLPRSMPELGVLIVDRCVHLNESDWLDASCCAKLYYLCVANTNLTRLPRSMPELQMLVASGCMHLNESDWLDPSGCPKLFILEASITNLTRLPTNMTKLVSLDVSRCACLDKDSWIDAASCAKLRGLKVGSTDLTRLPTNMTDLLELDVNGCACLDKDSWIDAASCGKLRKLDVGSTDLTRLPKSMTELVELDVSGCACLDQDDWIDAASCGMLRKLSSRGSSVQRLPPGISPGQLETWSH